MASKPVREFRAARHSKVVVWDNGDKGFSIKISPPSYKDDSGTWQETSFWTSDLPGIIHATQQALAWIDNLTEQRQKSSQANKNGEQQPTLPGIENEIPY